MIYLDTSVALAQLLAEDERPEPGFWEEELIASRLLEYELARVALVEMVPPVLVRALQPFPLAVRTLDALHP